MSAVRYEHIHRMGSLPFAAVKPAGSLPRLNIGGSTANLNVINWQGRSWECDSRQMGYSFLHGSEPHLHIVGMGLPDVFWQSIGSKQKEPGWAVGRFQGEPGNPQGPITWQAVSDLQVSPILWKTSSSVLSYLGHETVSGNIAACRADGKDIITTHISGDQDRRLIHINPDGWTKTHPERQQLIEQLDGISLSTDIESTVMSADRTRLLLTSKIKDRSGRPIVHEIDISWIAPSVRESMYVDIREKKHNVRLIESDPRIDFEVLEREQVTVFHNETIRFLDYQTIRAYRDEQGVFKVTVENRPTARDPKPEPPIVLAGKTFREIRKSDAYKALPREVRRAIIKTLWETYETPNLPWSRVKKMRHRYSLQYYNYRESRIRNALETPLQENESVIALRVESSAKVVHLDEANGRPRGFEETIPLPFDPTEGHPEQFRLINFDPRPNSIHATRFVRPVDTAIAPQHLIDPYVMGTEIMAAVWPKADQLGFFGPFMLTAMAFPHGKQFTDSFMNPWFVSLFGSTSHSIFDGKRDAGRSYSLFGNAMYSAKMVGAAMVTGPNTDSASPVREGRLFPVRIPGRPPIFVKTAIPGSYIEVIEDALSSYMFMRMFGLVTETTVLTLSAGGGLDNYQLSLIVQRGQRWNAGKNIYSKDAWEVIYEDMIRGPGFTPGSIYHQAKTFVLRGDMTAVEATQENIDRADGLGAIKAEKAAAVATSSGTKAPVKLTIAPNQPVAKMFEPAEAREWLNVGTWYWDSGAKLVSFSMVAIAVSLGVAPLAVAGAAFFFVCLAMTMFSWPFWATQMAKVGIAPKTIISVFPKHLFWGNLSMHTTVKSGFDMERLGVGKFRISDRNAGNRVPLRDKRTSFWVGIVLPSTAGTLLVGGALAITVAMGVVPLALAGFPFIAGWLASRFLDKWASRLLPNANQQSFAKAALRFAARNVPFALGIGASLLVLPYYAVFAIPLVTAAMAGGWSLFMGANILKEFSIYHKEQRETFTRPEPNPTGIPRHQADTWRNTLREIFGIRPPAFTKQEFTASSNPKVDPYKLWEAIDTAKAGLLDKPSGNPMANLNSLVNGEGTRIVYLYDELKEKLAASKTPWIEGILRRRKIARLAAQTRNSVTTLPREHRLANLFEAEQYDMICELNRLVIEEAFPGNTPRERWI
ncbi:MAG: hypothetical protein ABIH56_06350 [Candidatus Margulisiibacteriota bacterium]